MPGKSDMRVEQYLKWKKYHAPRAAKAYEVWVRRFQAFTNKPVEDLTIHDWTDFAESIGSQDYAPKSVQFGLNVIHNYLRYWRDLDVLPRFPLVLAKVPKATGCPHNAATEEEYRAMIRVLRAKGEAGLRDLAIVMLLHDTGMRVGEVIQLEIDQVEPDASAVIRTEKTVQRRRVFWNPETDLVVQQLIVQRVNTGASTDWLFVAGDSQCERQLLTRNIQRMVKRVTKLAHIERRLSPHSFRHALIHRLAKLGVPDAVIARVVGHGSPHSISHYTQLSRPEFKEIAEKQFRAFALAA
jgi:site-specific recombinase XerD